MRVRGYFGIGIYHTKTEINVGTLWRSAHNFGASFIFTIGRRYRQQASDTTKVWKTIPLYHYGSFDELKENIPMEARIIAIEQSETSTSLVSFIHPEQCIYLLGAEDHGLPESILDEVKTVVHINTPMCLNVSTAGSIVMYDRSVKGTENKI
jgi:tRNA(Leu) C34 or U34 (ribose-2'-O)-methylase TrmL